jgi:hypothetical protein
VNPSGQAVLGPQVSSPALECPSRICLLQPTGGTGGDGGAGRATCTASCENDGDCDPETRALCKAGFVCAVASQTGPYCCKKLCVCRDDLQAGVNGDGKPDGGTMIPFSCDPKQNSNITCPNVKVQ